MATTKTKKLISLDLLVQNLESYLEHNPVQVKYPGP